MSVLPATHFKRWQPAISQSDEITQKNSITLFKTSIIQMWSLSINDRTERISQKCMNNEGKGGEEITEVLGDVALALQRRTCSLKCYNGCHENRYLYKKNINYWYCSSSFMVGRKRRETLLHISPLLELSGLFFATPTLFPCYYTIFPFTPRSWARSLLTHPASSSQVLISDWWCGAGPMADNMCMNSVSTQLRQNTNARFRGQWFNGNKYLLAVCGFLRSFCSSSSCSAE